MRIEKKSIGTINEEDYDDEASDEIVMSTNKKVKLDDYRSISFGKKDEIISRFNAPPPPPPPAGMMRPPPLPPVGVINLVQ